MILLSNHSGCGFYEPDLVTDCCKPNGVTPYATNCLSNGSGPECQADNFGGIPSIDGSGSSNVCNGNEAWGDVTSDLMAPINSPCSCFPSRHETCTIENNHRVCRIDQMLWDGNSGSASESDEYCDGCRKCMMDKCSETGVNVDFTTVKKAEQTMNNWISEKTGCQGDQGCEDLCRYKTTIV